MDYAQNCEEFKGLDYCLKICLTVSNDVTYFCELFFQYLSLTEHLDGDEIRYSIKPDRRHPTDRQIRILKFLFRRNPFRRQRQKNRLQNNNNPRSLTILGSIHINPPLVFIKQNVKLEELLIDYYNRFDIVLIT